MSAAPDTTLADLQQANDDLRHQLAERTAERDEGLAREAAMAEVLGVINSLPGDLATVFNSILEKAHSLCGADFGSLQLNDHGEFRSVAARGLAHSLTELLRQPFEPPAGSPPARLLGGERVVHVADMAELASQWTDYRRAQAAAEHGFRTALFVPLRRDADLLGFIVAVRREVRLYSEKEISLLENFAAQAVIAVESARLLTETREALEQQTATAEVLQVINSSPGDVAAVFDVILEKAHNLCGAAHGYLMVREGEEFRVAAVHGEPRLFEYWRQQGPFRPPKGTAMGRAVRGKQIVHVADALAYEGYDDLPMFRHAAEAGGIRTMLVVPFRKDDRVLGFITAVRREVRPFADNQIALLENFAAQAVIAMENARLLDELRARTADLEQSLEYQTATSDVLQVISRTTFDLQPVLDTLVESAARLCAADLGLLSNREGEGLRVAATFSTSPEYEGVIRGRFAPIDRGTVAGRAMLEGRTVQVTDLTSDPDYAVTENITLGKVRTGIGVPLLREGAAVGVLSLGRQRVEPFSERQIELVRTFADQAVIAMENARLLTETREALEQQTATAEVLQVINASPDELGPVFDAILKKGRTLCGADHGELALYDGEKLRAVAVSAGSNAFTERLREGVPAVGNPIGQPLLDGARFVHIPDQAEIDHPLTQAAVKGTGARTVLAVPLRKGNVLLGIIVAVRLKVHPFTDKQIALFENFAAQAVIAIENARLITETREALEQQTAAAEVLQVINSSPGNLAQVFDAMLENAMRLCGASFGTLRTYDGDQLHGVASRGVPAAYAAFLASNPRQARSGTIAARILDGERLVHVIDVADDEVYRSGDPHRRALVNLGGAHTYLAVPMRKDDVLLGVLTVYRQEVRPFTDKQIALLQNFAAQAVIAIENARLLGELRARTTDLEQSLEYQTATSDVLKVISRSAGELDPVLQTLTETAARLCEADTAAIIRLRDGQYWLAASLGFSAEWSELLGREPVEPSRATITGRALLEGRAVHVQDVMTDREYRWLDAQQLGGYRTGLAVPLLRDSKQIGVITLGRLRVEPFTEKQIALVSTFADQAVIAIENARLFGELRQRTDEVVELNRDLEARVTAQVDELGRVGRLKRFLAPQLAEMIIAKGEEGVLESHRRDIVVVFCDLRGYTAFTETAEPEDVLDFLREYHGALGPLVSRFEGTLDQFSGDGIMVFFNDPVPCPNPAERAVKMAMAMREAASKLIGAWRRRHRFELGFGVGIAQGYATLGQIGFPERSGYTAIGTVCNLAARLCAEAKDGQILVSSRVAGAVEAIAQLEDLGDLGVKGLSRPVAAFNVMAPVRGAPAGE
jgi:GAF domain-containing protein